jgi:uracil-DNA glycosylase
MFIGGAPGKDEELEGSPFVGVPGQFLKEAIGKANLTTYYLSNLVACRSCGEVYDGEGALVTYTNRRTGETTPMIGDKSPDVSQVQECLPRLYEEIYLVDPIFIVTLGAEAAKALTGKPIAITTQSGIEREVEIPGAWRVPVRTEKKKVWGRKVRGEMTFPTEVNMVKYLLIPLMDPAYVLRYQSDERQGSPMHTFVEGMKKVADVYNRYMVEVFGSLPQESNF